MSFGPELRSLDTTATQLEQHAAEIRARAGRLRAASESVNWCSAGASAFRQHGELTCDQLQRSADRLDHAASVLRRHASTARSRLGLAETVVSTGLHLVGL